MNALLFERPIWFATGPLVLEEDVEPAKRLGHGLEGALVANLDDGHHVQRSALVGLSLEDAGSPSQFPEVAVEVAQERLEGSTPSDAAKTKALLALLIAEISVKSRTEIKPTYRVPFDLEDELVRQPREKVGRTGIEPVTLRLRVSCSTS